MQTSGTTQLGAAELLAVEVIHLAFTPTDVRVLHEAIEYKVRQEQHATNDEAVLAVRLRKSLTSTTSDCEADAPKHSLLDHSTLAMEAIGHLQACGEAWASADPGKLDDVYDLAWNWLRVNAESVNTLTS